MIILDVISHQWHCFAASISVYSNNSIEPTMSTISIPQILKDCYQTFLRAILEFSILTFTECDRTDALVWLEHLGVIQWRVSMTIIASIVKLDVLTL